MFTMKNSLIILLLVLTAGMAWTQNTLVTRYALVVGANDGGQGTERLLYAGKDAENFAALMTEIGGVEPEKNRILIDPSPQDIVREMNRMNSQIRRGREERKEFIFYYSGHSDTQGLLLRGRTMTYGDLKTAIEGLDADVTVAILDSCYSGEFIRTKGGSRVPPFMMDESTEVTGHAFLTSSSANEEAQESDAIQASYFTHNLVSGLRGGADLNQDRRISMMEAYTYSSAETVSRTQSSYAGVQHPSYNFNLSGQGDFVLTDLSGAEAQISFDAAMEGRLFIQDENSNLVAEMNKKKEQEITLALPSGDYTVLLDTGNEFVYEQNVTLNRNSVRSVTFSTLTAQNRDAARIRGSEESADPELEERYINLSFVYPVGLWGIQSQKYKYNVSASVLVGISGAIEGVDASAIGSIVRYSVSGVQASCIFTIAGGDVIGVQAGLLNITGGGLTGVQAGLLNYAHRISGPGGVQAGLLNITGGNNSADYPVQAGLMNIAADNSSAGFPVQAGLVNYSGSKKGLQVGLVNIATGEGNIDHFYPIGLINIVSGGMNEIEMSFSEFGQAATYRLGSKWLYSVYSVRNQWNRKGISFGLGLGFRAPVTDNMAFHLEGEWYSPPVQIFTPANSRENREYSHILQIRPLVSLFNSKMIGVYAGPTFNIVFSDSWIDQEYTVPGISADPNSNFWFGGHIGIALSLNHRKKNI